MPYEMYPSDEAMSEFVHQQIRAYNRPYLTDREDLSQHIMNENGACVAGIVADRCGELISVDLLWVDEGSRGHGLGASLLERVEALGRAGGGKRVYLFTFQFQAPEFYPKFGYRLIQKLEAGPSGSSQYHYEKELL